MTIFLNHNTQKMSFQNCPIHLVTSNSNYRLIDFQSPVYPEYGVTFKECSLINSSESSTAPSGNSLYSDYALQVRILDTYASAAKGGSGTLTNLITQGNKLMIDPQLKL